MRSIAHLSSSSVHVVDASGARLYTKDLINDLTLGTKALTLLSVPQQWTTPFIVVSSTATNLAEPVLTKYIEDALTQLPPPSSNLYIVRSSAVHETLEERGSLRSEDCPREKIASVVKRLAERTSDITNAHVHWIIQEFHQQKRLGHLSNVRRVSKEARDWKYEILPLKGVYGSSGSFGIRKWRSEAKWDHRTPLSCEREFDIEKCLREVGIWAFYQGSRCHIEWLWDGAKLLVVQVDLEERRTGPRPHDVRKISISRKERTGELVLFQEATGEQFDLFRKLRNANTYRALGYQMPPFYVLDSAHVLRGLKDSIIPEGLVSDLELLTKRPLIIRTDGRDLPASKVDMLPRSDELRSASEAIEWLRKALLDKLTASEVHLEDIVLIAHHYIPSVASAWVRAEPDNPVVRVESLWGIPEGLYWFPHDVYHVDTVDSRVEDHAFSGPSFKATKRIRCKSNYVAANSEGRWTIQPTFEPDDWGETIADSMLLSEIAWTTKRIAQRENQDVSVMWFIGNHKEASPHRALPWFHSECAPINTIREQATPIKRRRNQEIVKISTVLDWEKLLLSLKENRTVDKVRIIPHDPELIRNPKFADDLAIASREYNFAIVLEGGILSHVYYTLVRHEAIVECVDLFGTVEERTDFFKIVRDYIPESIAKRGEKSSVVQLVGEAKTTGLKRKLLEEAFEVLDARSARATVEEVCDVLDVVDSLLKHLGASRADISDIRKRKNGVKGGFNLALMVIDTKAPSAWRGFERPLWSREAEGSLNFRHGSAIIVEEPLAIPSRPSYRRPDSRALGSGTEKMLVSEIDIGIMSTEDQKTQWQVDVSELGAHVQTVDVECSLQRHGVMLRTTTRLKNSVVQFEFNFDE